MNIGCWKYALTQGPSFPGEEGRQGPRGQLHIHLLPFCTALRMLGETTSIDK